MVSDPDFRREYVPHNRWALPVFRLRNTDSSLLSPAPAPSSPEKKQEKDISIDQKNLFPCLSHRRSKVWTGCGFSTSTLIICKTYRYGFSHGTVSFTTYFTCIIGDLSYRFNCFPHLRNPVTHLHCRTNISLIPKISPWFFVFLCYSIYILDI